MRSVMIAILLAPLVLSAAVVSGDAGVAEARKPSLGGGALKVDSLSHAWNQLAWYHRGRADAPLQPHAVVTAQGERYVGRITNWDGTTLRFAADPGASIELNTDDLAGVVFQPAARLVLPGELPAMLRRDGPAVAGTLGRMAPAAVAVEGPLGAFSFSYRDAKAYAWRTANAASVDQVTLVGGARVHGAAKIDGDRIVLEHPRLGTLRVPLSAVQEIRRQRPGLRWLGGTATVHRHQGAVGDVPAPQAIDAFDETAGFSVVTDTMLSWPGAAGTVVLRASAGSEPVGVVIAVDKKSVGKLRLAPGESQVWHVKVPAGKRLLMACKSVGPRPGSIDIHAPHLVEAR